MSKGRGTGAGAEVSKLYQRLAGMDGSEQVEVPRSNWRRYVGAGILSALCAVGCGGVKDKVDEGKLAGEDPVVQEHREIAAPPEVAQPAADNGSEWQGGDGAAPPPGD